MEGTPRMVEIIIGASLYTCTEDIVFVQEYKRQIKLLVPVANIFLFIRDNVTPDVNHKTLCELKALAQKVSSVFGVDMTERYTDFIDTYREEIMFLNMSLGRLTDMAVEYLYVEESLQYVLEISDTCFTFSITDSEKLAEIVRMYAEEFKTLGL